MVVNYLAKRTWGRIVLFPLVIACGAFSWAQIQFYTSDQSKQFKAHEWGWDAPEMKVHWDRLADPTSPDYLTWFHSTKNIGSEWVRLEAQRAYKAMSFQLAVWAIEAFAVGVALGHFL